MQKRFLFLYLKTGGGHLSAARALSEYYQKHYGDDVHISMRDGREDSPILKVLLEEGYTKIQTHGKPIYEFMYACNKFYICAKTNQILISQCIVDDIATMIRTESPDHIVIFHFFLTKPVKDALKKIAEETGKKIRVTIIVTDPFTAPILRFLEGDMEYIVFSTQAKHTAIEQGVPESQIVVLPTLIHEKYNHLPSEGEVHNIKIHRQIPLHKNIIMIGGGGDGMPKGEEILEEIIKKIDPVVVLMVCGKNEELYKKAKKIVDHYNAEYIHLYQFIDFMYDLVAVADIVITKAGPAAIMETLSLQKIPVLNSYLREQERGNMEFVVNNQVGIYEEHIPHLIERVKELLSGGLNTYQNNVKNLHVRSGVGDIAGYLMSSL